MIRITFMKGRYTKLMEELFDRLGDVKGYKRTVK